MPHEVVTKMLLIAVAIAVAGLAAAVLAYLLGVGVAKAEIIVERVELGQGSGIFTIRNVSNLKIVRVDRLELICSSGTVELDPGMISTPVPPGRADTIIFMHNISAGDSCKLFIEAEA